MDREINPTSCKLPTADEAGVRERRVRAEADTLCLDCSTASLA